MGVRLIREVLEHAPADLTPAELVVLLVLAEDANDRTRKAYPGIEELARRTRIGPRGIRMALARLAARGIEVRMVIGKDAAGRPLYACRGRQTTYLLPPLAPERGNAGSAIQDRKGEPAFRHSGGKGEPPFRQSAGKGEPPFPPSPQLAKKQQRAEAIVIEHTGATPQEAAAAVAILKRDRPDIRSLPAVLARFDPTELTELVDRARADTQRATITTALAAARQAPPCPHGQAGGDQPHPTSGEPICVTCRVIRRQAS